MPAVATARAARVLPRALFGLAALIGVACYRPNIKDGGFLCNVDAGPSHQCPEGFSCDQSVAPALCWRGPHDAGGGDRSDAVDAPDAAPDADASADAHQGVAEFGACTVTPQCAAGLVCIGDNCGGRCYRRCSSDADCPASSCSKATPDGGSACDVPRITCDPRSKSSGGQTGCAIPSQACYLSASDPDATLCDCPGGSRTGDVCTSSRDCLAGLVCVDALGSGVRYCQAACLIGGSDCGALTCRPYAVPDSGAPSATYGFCY
jgi:hypothetical protein